MICLTVEARAQWLVPPQGWLARGDFDRPHAVARHRGLRPLAMPQPEPHNWLFPNVNVTSSPYFSQNEPAVAINPLDSLNIIIGANDDRIYNQMGVYSTTDGGLTWLNQFLPNSSSWNDLAYDPSIAFDRFGTAYFLCGRSANDGTPQPQNDVALFQSSDHGQTWQWKSDVFADTVLFGSADTLADKYYLTIDVNPASPYRDRMYAVWVDYGQNDPHPRIVSSHSSDGGSSWSHRVYLTNPGFFTAPIPAVAPDGTLLVTFTQYWDSTAIWIAHSADGGASFSTPGVFGTYKNLATPTPNDNNGYETLGTDTDLVMINSFASVAVSAAGPHKGLAYVCWCGKGIDNIPHVWLSMSDDAKTWSMPKIVDIDLVPNAYSRYFSWIATDPQSGDVGIDYYVSPNGPSSILSDLYMEHSTDGGTTFAARQISSLSSSLSVKEGAPRQPEGHTLWFIGDYINIAGWNNTWHPVWADSRSVTDLDIYTATVQPFAPMPVSNLVARDTMVNDKKATVISWDYTPETTFGYPLLNGYIFLTRKNSGKLDSINSSTMQFVDTSAGLGYYKVSVLANGLESVRDSVSNLPRSVQGGGSTSGVRVAILRQPATVGLPDAITIECERPCSVTLLFYDELGRAIGEPIEDAFLSNKHVLPFTPVSTGVSFYVLRVATSDGVWQKTGRLLAKPSE